jgi:hypothetical protein
MRLFELLSPFLLCHKKNASRITIYKKFPKRQKRKSNKASDRKMENTSPKHDDDDDQIECVGSLLVHSHDVQELDSNHIPSPSIMPSVATLQKHPTVGTLLVPTTTTDNTTAGADESSAPTSSSGETKEQGDAEQQKSPSLIRRITEKLNFDVPEDCDYDEWME